MKFLTWVQKLPQFLSLAIGFILIGVVGFLDFLTGFEIAFSLFYLIPIFIVTWSINRSFGIAASFISAAAWLFADLEAGNSYSSPFVFLWNTIIRLAFFIITTVLLSIIQKTLEEERNRARTDFLTGALNSRSFYDYLQLEIAKSKRYRHTFSLAYIDLDNFKSVNDRLGHSTGDQVLLSVVTMIKKFVRETDIVSRLGGDEFVIYMPESGLEDARTVISRVQNGLSAEMLQMDWPVTFSIGVMIFKKMLADPDDMVRLADDVMYSVKHESKNAVKYLVYPN